MKIVMFKHFQNNDTHKRLFDVKEAAAAFATQMRSSLINISESHWQPAGCEYNCFMVTVWYWGRPK